MRSAGQKMNRLSHREQSKETGVGRNEEKSPSAEDIHGPSQGWSTRRRVVVSEADASQDGSR